MKSLIAFFSRKDENYVDGVLKILEIGNTEIAASVIQKLTSAELFHIVPKQAYCYNYNECIAQAQTDQCKDARPELKNWLPDITAYDTIYLGYPNYWGTMPMAVFTFLEHYDFSGKTIMPFCTHEGSGLGSSIADIKRLCPTAGYEKAKESIADSLKKLQTDYIDLMLIHQPFSDYYGAYRAMEEAYKEGKIRAIGVSNFYPDRLIDLCTFAAVTPAVNQVETHVMHQQKQAHEIMTKYGVIHESWAPFAEGRKDFFINPLITEIGCKYGKSTAQTALRYLLQNDVVVIPKSVHRERMVENFDVFDFVLSAEDMDRIATLDEKKSAFFSHEDPDTVEWFMSIIK